MDNLKEGKKKERSVRVMLMPHEYECLKAESKKEQRTSSGQIAYILRKRYKKLIPRK